VSLGPCFSREKGRRTDEHDRGIAKAEGVHNWISKQLPAGPKPPLTRPINWMKIIFLTTTVLGSFSAIAVAAPYVMPIIQNRNVWAAISLLLVLLFTSGHMFNHIRKVPYVAGDGRGGVSYFAGGFQSQYGLETQVIAALCKSSISSSSMIVNRLTFLQMVFYLSQPSTLQSNAHALLMPSNNQ
jgi:oligosaccharyltransferase complex subunit gamma